MAPLSAASPERPSTESPTSDIPASQPSRPAARELPPPPATARAADTAQLVGTASRALPQTALPTPIIAERRPVSPPTPPFGAQPQPPSTQPSSQAPQHTGPTPSILTRYWQFAVATAIGILVFLVLLRPFAAQYLSHIKAFSLAVTLLFYLLYHWERPHNPKTNKLTDRGKWVYSVLILSACTALAALLLEEGQKAEATRRAEHEAQLDRNSKAQLLSNVLAQVALQRRSIGYVERLVGTFTDLTIRVTFQCVPNHPLVTTLNRHAIANHKKPPLNTNTYSLNIVGFVNIGTDSQGFSVVQPSASQSQSPFEQFLACPLNLTNGPDTNSVSFLECLRNPRLNVAIFSPRGPRPDWPNADFHVSTAGLEPTPSLQVKDDSVILSYQFTLSSTNCLHTQRISSIPDFLGASLWVCVTNCPWEMRSFLRPLHLSLIFDKATISTTEPFGEAYSEPSFPASRVAGYTNSAQIREMLLDFQRTNALTGVFTTRLPDYDTPVLDLLAFPSDKPSSADTPHPFLRPHRTLKPSPQP